MSPAWEIQVRGCVEVGSELLKQMGGREHLLWILYRLSPLQGTWKPVTIHHTGYTKGRMNARGTIDAYKTGMKLFWVLCGSEQCYRQQNIDINQRGFRGLESKVMPATEEKTERLRMFCVKNAL